MFKPSDVSLTLSFPPLCNAMGKAEREHAATLIVRCCQLNGDTWQPCTPRQLGEAIRHDLDEKIDPLHSLNTNPFFRPDFRELAASGYARFVGDPDLKNIPIELTQKGLESLVLYVDPSKREGL